MSKKVATSSKSKRTVVAAPSLDRRMNFLDCLTQLLIGAEDLTILDYMEPEMIVGDVIERLIENHVETPAGPEQGRIARAIVRGVDDQLRNS